MTYRELYETATRQLEKSEITLGEYEKMTKVLDREIGTCKNCKHWQRIEHAISSNGRCKHFDDVWRGNSILPLEHGTTEDFYCADFKRRE